MDDDNADEVDLLEIDDAFDAAVVQLSATSTTTPRHHHAAAALNTHPEPAAAAAAAAATESAFIHFPAKTASTTPIAATATPTTGTAAAQSGAQMTARVNARSDAVPMPEPQQQQRHAWSQPRQMLQAPSQPTSSSKPATAAATSASASASSGNHASAHNAATAMAPMPSAAASVAAPKAVTVRRFPGPAGQLPPLRNNQVLSDAVVVLRYQHSSDASEAGGNGPDQADRRLGQAGKPGIELPSTQAFTLSQAMPSSQQLAAEDDEFTRGAWQTMLCESAESASEYYELTADFNLQFAKRFGYDHKIPFLVVLLKNYNPLDVDASVTLKDPTGEMSGTIHHKVLEEFGSLISAGAVLILKDVSVFSPTPRTQHLNVTLKNIVRIFCSERDYPSQDGKKPPGNDRFVEPAIWNGILQGLFDVARAAKAELERTEADQQRQRQERERQQLQQASRQKQQQQQQQQQNAQRKAITQQTGGAREASALHQQAARPFTAPHPRPTVPQPPSSPARPPQASLVQQRPALPQQQQQQQHPQPPPPAANPAVPHTPTTRPSGQSSLFATAAAGSPASVPTGPHVQPRSAFSTGTSGQSSLMGAAQALMAESRTDHSTPAALAPLHQAAPRQALVLDDEFDLADDDLDDSVLALVDVPAGNVSSHNGDTTDLRPREELKRSRLSS
ncbi:hypothetical protein CAOG_02012 [Capsaspora owczarzaki ATCC 30864]|uniref:Homologous recombination OB-fold protein OB-fold domain-containing protein n=1 Tax=Capsaspora owczarzaki (strain ATCC 30864) TaxID=595528 RepID=A0A0D2VKZ9_CAPO3|nr:hypothetical protein CAOG_02012 [Capsaspora owczarzaki ATCC 30864]KJE90757.1 hypothetical protein, variant 3 [Capsaspora owczarzaki ATCC 30864]|eukprot:XP_004348762.1 hypothetical protein CAOG_02012 [Capsaspora owczarzaki ATCC 30864]